ncbi:hypothetical protein [Polyangium fumosum]|uniref:Uncharacterized protein n=1 Tax=Polyangium fumosum TaxID=889272 RepID=A0A4U1JIY8_9BACT|nr:hypothetical protein [Polyangium fumosum]TKD12666.1 hypothetical protein E8A74_02635 [Polyangium fumosum]
MPLPPRRATALAALISLACGCRDAKPPTERAPSAVLTQSVSAAPTSTSNEAPRKAEPLGPASPLVEFEGLAKLDPKPLVVLRERNPWLMVLGSDVPTIVVYEDGLVVYHKLVGNKAEALTANVGAEAAKKLGEELATADFMALPAQASVTAATDQPTVGIALRQGSQWK